MKFWLIVFLFTADGQFMAKDMHEVEDRAQCEKLAGEVARVHLNTQLHIQMHCLSDEEYKGETE